jgi:ribose transport system substrate-binding protein
MVVDHITFSKRRNLEMTRRNWLKGGLVILFCLLFAATAFAGGGGEKPPAGKGFVVGLSNGPFLHSWRIEMLESLQKQFDMYRDKGWASKLIVQNAGPDVNTQIAQIRNLIASKVNLLLINPNSSTALDPVIKEAQDAGILVIVYDQPVPNPNVLNIYMNQEWWQSPLTEWLVKQLNGKGNIVYISGIADQPGNILRDQAAMKVLAKYPGIKLLTKANGNWDPAAAQQVMTDLLGSFPNIDGVLTQDGMTTGIIRAFEAAGKKVPPVTGDTLVAFIKDWKQRKDASGFNTVGIENSPGAVSTSLGIGLRLLQGKKLKSDLLIVDPNVMPLASKPHVIWTHPSLQVDNTNIDKVYGEYNDWADSFYVNIWYTEDQIDALFQ